MSVYGNRYNLCSGQHTKWEPREPREPREPSCCRASGTTHTNGTGNLSEIWGFHGGDYEECRLLGYKNPVRTSQETHYISAKQPNQLMLCKIWGFHGSDYVECRLLWYKIPVRTSKETQRFRYRDQPVNTMWEFRFSRRWLRRMTSSGI
jgi:hypothetical protein